jgi:MFS family permease
VTTLGLRANWRQFVLLVVVNGFVGAMVGLERSTLPLVARSDFGVASTAAVLSFIVAFGLAKAFTNLAAGWFADRRARKPALIVGWFVGLPVPLLILWAPSWSWIVTANVLLGINQGLAWSTTVIMKIDLVGSRRRGLAMGLNEFAGYLAVGLAALGSGVLATRLGLRPATAYLGLGVAVIGLVLSAFVRETAPHARLAAAAHRHQPRPRLVDVLKRSLWTDAGLFSASQAGFVNNLNDGLAWGVFPLVFKAAGLTLNEMSVLAAIYPMTWGIGQLATGAMSDRWGRKRFIVSGMLVQGAALIGVALCHGFIGWAAALALLGAGTAMVYPTLLAMVGDVAHPSWRGAGVGVYRLWRDLGYVGGAVIAGALSDASSMTVAIAVIGVLTAASGLGVAIRLPSGSPARRLPAPAST